VRREVAFATKVAARADAPRRLEAFYARWLQDSVADLLPWVRRLVPAGGAALDGRLATQLEAWTAEARGALVAALATAGLEDLLRRWEIERAAILSQRVLEVCHA
jgi:hypothetical protein